MQDFGLFYRQRFERLGYPLGKKHALSSQLLSRTEERLGVTIPPALREYYLVAGKEKRFSNANHRFLHPSDWFVNGKHIVFVQENQSVCWWGVSVKSRDAHNPMVSQAVNDEPIDEPFVWNMEQKKCSAFISLMLHYQAVNGGFPFCGWAAAPDDLHAKLKKDWTHIGEGNQLWVISRQNQVVCVEVNSMPIMPAMMVTAGAKTKMDLHTIEESLSLTLR